MDDYLLQLRFGRKYGFNFQAHKDDKVGILRSYVKRMKSYHAVYERDKTIPIDGYLPTSETGCTKECCSPLPTAFETGSNSFYQY